MNRNKIIDFEQLWESSLKCKNGVSWKPNVKSFGLNRFKKCLQMQEQLKSGTWKNGNPHRIIIPYPKKRQGLSVSFKDRVYQRSINDNQLYPTMTKSFIIDNCACQKGKGTSFARKRIKKHIWNFYTHHKLDGWILQIDIHGYYPSMPHKKVNEMFDKHLDPEISAMVKDVLQHQYSGDVGYNPGSQMVQIAGISYLNDLDHKIKEEMHIKHYIRYMDDFWILHENKQYLEQCLQKIREELAELRLSLNEKKTHIRPMGKKFTFLGFDYRILESGKIIMTVNSASVKHERKKLFRMVAKAKRGEITRQKVDECYKAWKAFAEEGNSYKLLKRMDEYYQSLWEDGNENQSQGNANSARETIGSSQVQNIGSGGSD